MNLIKLVFISLFFVTHGNTADVLVNLSPKNVYFIGRGESLQTINKSIKDNDVFLLFGTGGIGKSQIAKQYAWLNAPHYDFIWWVDSGQSIDAQAVDFARGWNEGIQTEVITLSKDTKSMWKNIVARLIETGKKGLIIFDDVHKYNDNEVLLQELSKKTQHHIIATTRNAKAKENYQSTQHIKEFNRKESIELLKKLNPNKYKDLAQLNEFAALLKDYPLSIAQAFAYIESSGLLDVGQYVEDYKKRRDQLAKANDIVTSSSGKSFTDGYRLTTETTTDMTLEQIKKESLDAFDLAQLLSLLNNIDIPEPLIWDFFGADAIKASSVIALLLKYGIIAKNTRNNINLYSIHESISDIIQTKITANKKRLLLKVSQSINHLIPDTLNQSIDLFEHQAYYLNHIEKVFLESLKSKIFSVDLINIKIRQLEYVLTEKRDKNHSQIIIDEITHLLEKTWFVPPITQARFFLMKAAFSGWMLDDLDKSNKEALEAEKYLKKQKNIRNEELMMLYLRLSQNYVFQGDADSAVKYSQLAENIPATDPASSKYNLDIIYQAKGIALWDKEDLENASIYFERAAKEDKNTSKMTLIGIASYQHRVLIAQKEFDKVLKLTNIVENRINKYVDKNTYFSYISYMMRANYLYWTGDIEKALENIHACISVLKSFYPDYQTKGNRKFGYVYMIAGDIYAAKKDYETAMDYYQQAEKMYFSGLKYQKIYEVSDLYTKMAKLSFDTKDNFKAADYRDKHENLFGIADNNSLEINLHLNQQPQ